jgi:hypothetical protein
LDIRLYYVYIEKMPSYSTAYRHTHPEYYEKEKAATIQRVLYKYNNDPEFRERVKSQARARYHAIKNMKLAEKKVEEVAN